MKMSEMAVKAVIALFVVNAASIEASSSSSSSSSNVQTVSLNEISNFLLDANDIINDIDSYAKLWIKPHNCVWSECAVDDTDDGYTGDNRDGDEQWYQYRTQGFCANAAYSLYGVKKIDQLLPSFSGCSNRHFINSFFTYGGADTLLQAVGKTPVTYSAYGNYNNNNGDDDGYTSVNAQCQEIDYQVDDYAMADDQAEDQDRNLGSNDNDNDGYGGTLGCSADGSYVFAAFASESCDGNYFAGIVDDFRDYNKQHHSIGCHKIYGSLTTSNEKIVELLSNSWSCDLRLYPNGCPDPYGKKEKYDWAVRTISHGGNPYLAYKNMVLKTPITIISWIFFIFSLLIVSLTYLLKNEFRAQSKGGKNFIGYGRCLWEDIILAIRGAGSNIAHKGQIYAQRMKRMKKKRKSRRKSKGEKESRRSKKRTKKSRKDQAAESEADYYSSPEIKVTNAATSEKSDAAYANIDDIEN